MNVGFMHVVQVIKHNIKSSRNCGTFTKRPPWNILFFGADEFSIYSLRALHREYENGSILKKLEVVTTTKGKANPVKKYADQHNLPVHSWPVEGIEYTFDVGLVVSFGHLIPKSVINQFPLGMLNVHASLLPRWRGAAPITYTLANGDKETGITIMRIRPVQFDIGELLFQTKIPVSSDLKLPELHEKLGNLGAQCLVDSLQNLPERLKNAKPQPSDGITYAPKVTPEFTVVRWQTMSSNQIYNLERAVTGLLPLRSSWNGIAVKLHGVTDCTISESTSNNEQDKHLKPGFVKCDKGSKTLRVLCANRTWISVEKIGVFGKRLMSAIDFNNGYIKKEPLEKRYFR